VPDRPRLKDPKTFRIIGKPLARLDSEVKVRGEAVYGMDVQFEGLRTARVAHPPTFGGKLKRLDAARARAVPGVRHVVEIQTGVAVVADHYWAATRGLEALDAEWEAGPHGELDSEAIAASCEKALHGGRRVRNDGDATRVLSDAAAPIEARYRVPFLAHATMEPMNCSARVSAERCEVWAPTQSPTGVQQTAAEITGLPPERVSVETTFMGGGFGRRSANDFVADAVHAAKATGEAVKVVYSREDDMRAGSYRPVSTHAFAGALDGEGWPLAWRHQLACPSILGSKGWLQGDVDGTSVEGAANLPYAIPNLEVRYAAAEVPIPPHFWRSVGSSQNAYVTECFLDELARAGGKDPVALRERLLGDHPRHRRVLAAAAEKAGWGSPVAAGHARGVAVHECFGSVVAEVVEVSRPADGSVRVHNVVCAVDCGLAINPGIIAAQMESGIVYGLSAALYGQITIERGRAVETNFDRYPVLRMREMPTIETVIVDSDAPLGGIGEPSTPPIAPAVCNALAALGAEPIRELPIRPVTSA
jgi:isoquinoline 1-oxidoreductase beta subunit